MIKYKSVTAVAPNKVIITGEHAVVYGTPAISIAVETPTEVNVRIVKRKQLGLIVNHGTNTYEFDSNFQPTHDIKREWILNIGEHIQDLLKQEGTSLEKLDHSIEINVKASGSPKGTGNSAAQAAALNLAFRTMFGKTPNKEELFKDTQDLEAKAHGTPSGVDAMTVIEQNPVLFTRTFTQKGTKADLKPIQANLPRGSKLLLIDITNPSKESANTAVQVDAFAKAIIGKKPKEASKNDRASIRRKFTPISNAILREMKRTGSKSKLGRLLNENHALLHTYGVSNEDTERIVQIAREAGALGAKLTGAGGQNGAVIALIREKDEAKIVRELAKHRAKVTPTDISHTGTYVKEKIEM